MHLAWCPWGHDFAFWEGLDIEMCIRGDGLLTPTLGEGSRGLNITVLRVKS